jgi:hypothetical protein
VERELPVIGGAQNGLILAINGLKRLFLGSERRQKTASDVTEK